MVQGTGGVAWSSATQWPEGEIAIGEMSREEMESQLHSLLGDPGFSQYQDYDGSRAARMVASQLGSSLYLTDAPLTTDQASQVTAIVNASGINSGSPDWDGAISKAKDVLSGTQVAALSGLRQEWQYKQALDQAIDQAMEQATNQAKQASGIGTVPATVAR